MNGKKNKGYTLLKTYPGCTKKVGDFVPYTTGEFSQYPEFWEPVFENETVFVKKVDVKMSCDIALENGFPVAKNFTWSTNAEGVDLDLIFSQMIKRVPCVSSSISKAVEFRTGLLSFLNKK